MKKFIAFALLAAFIFSACGHKIAVKANGVYPAFIADAYVKKYTILVPEKTSQDYLLFMSKMPYIVFALHLNGYEFRGFNNPDANDAPIAIAVALSYNNRTYWSAQLNSWGNALTVEKVSRNRRVITFAAFDNNTKEALWHTTLTGWGGKITRDENFEIPAILCLGHKSIGKNKTELITAFPRVATFSKKYKQFTQASVKHFNYTVSLLPNRKR
ncbi:MAG: hypothetical protein LBQ47_03820 [Endomicrobium sp.]|jgi:hypothetical protein|nr:hypothetical protein [Endomicrobium sp.]